MSAVTVYEPRRIGLIWHVVQRTEFPEGVAGRYVRPFEMRADDRLFLRYSGARAHADELTRRAEVR